MTHTKEKIQDAKDEVLLAHLGADLSASTINTLLEVLDDALATAEKNSGVGAENAQTDGLRYAGSVDAIDDAILDKIYTRTEPQVVDVDGLLQNITSHIAEMHGREVSLRYMPCSAVVLSYITTHYTLTKRGV